MEAKGEINISPNYNKDSYLNLNLSLQSSQSDWNTAVAILKDRCYHKEKRGVCYAFSCKFDEFFDRLCGSGAQLCAGACADDGSAAGDGP